jgi:hypothetical protein
MKKEFLLMAVVLFGAIAPVLAQEGDIHGAAGITYDTRYVWRGFQPFGSQTAIHPFIDLDLMGTGFGIDVMAHRANHDGYELSERWDYTLYYQNSISAQDTYETDYRLSYVYYNYPDMSSHQDYHSRRSPGSVDLQELNALLSWPNITGVKGLVPRYCIVKLWPSNRDTIVGARNPNGGTASGFAHIFMLDYALPVQGLTAETPEQVLNFHTELVYNDGVEPRPGGSYKDSDWTDFVFGVSTDFDLGNNVIFTPGIYHQITMEDNGDYGYYGKGVSPQHDITWGSMTVKYKF